MVTDKAVADVILLFYRIQQRNSVVWFATLSAIVLYIPKVIQSLHTPAPTFPCKNRILDVYKRQVGDVLLNLDGAGSDEDKSYRAAMTLRAIRETDMFELFSSCLLYTSRCV